MKAQILKRQNALATRKSHVNSRSSLSNDISTMHANISEVRKILRMSQRQASLTIGAANDTYEIEADRMADEVMRMPESAINTNNERNIPFPIQRQTVVKNRDGEMAPTRVNDVIASPGKTLDPQIRGFFEHRFGRDFSRVRIHDNEAAGASAVMLGAQAYTAGNNIVFAKSQYSPWSSQSRRLIAHELVHVVQQGAAGHPISAMDRGPTHSTSPITAETSAVVVQRQSSGVITSADKMIAAHTSRLGLDENGLGGILSILVLSSYTSIPFVHDVLDSLEPGDRAQVAYAFVNYRPDEFIIELAGFQTGRELLVRIRDDMQNGFFLGDQIKRVSSILKSIAPGTPAIAIAQEVIRIYEAAPPEKQNPGGDCFEVTRERIEEATRAILGEDLTTTLPESEEGDLLSPENIFERLWGSLIQRDCLAGGELLLRSATRTWLSIDERYRGKGAAGAMAYAGKGRLIDQQRIWKSGALVPGAVIQTWKKADDYQRVKEGNCPQSYGHSFIFHSYVRDGNNPGGKITGMRIMDQGYQSDIVLPESAYGFWVAVNIEFGPTEGL